MPGKTVVKKPRRSLLQVVTIGALTVAVGVTGAISVRMHDNAMRPYEPPPFGGPVIPGDPPFPPVPAMPCQLSADMWLFGLCGSGDDYLRSVAISGDGTVFAAGSSNSVDGSFAGFQMHPANTNGYMAIVEPDSFPWLQRGPELVHDVKAAPDGTVVAVGEAVFNEAAATITKYDDEGEAIWQKQFFSAGLTPSFHGVAIGQDGAITAWGMAAVPDAEQPHVIVAQYTDDGVLNWWHDYGEVWTDVGSPESATVDADGNIFLVGASLKPTPGGGSLEAMVSKLDPSGDLVWAKTYGGDSIHGFKAVTNTPNGHVVAVGSGGSIDGGSFPGVLAEIDQSGNVVSLWTHEVLANTEFKAIAPTPSGGYAIAGYTGAGTEDALVLVVRDTASIGSSNFLYWQRSFGGSGDDLFEGIAVDSNGDIVVAGHTDSTDGNLPPSSGGRDAVLLRLTADGQVVTE